MSFVQASQYYAYGAVEFFIVGYMIDIAKLDALFSGVFLTVQVATIIVARPAFGRLSDKKGRRAPILLGSLIGCLLLFAVPFTTQFPILLLLAVGYGLGFAMVISSTSPLMSELAPAGLVGSSMGFLHHDGYGTNAWTNSQRSHPRHSFRVHGTLRFPEHSPDSIRRYFCVFKNRKTKPQVFREPQTLKETATSLRQNSQSKSRRKKLCLSMPASEPATWNVQ